MPSNYNGRGGSKKSSDGKIAEKVRKQAAAAFFCCSVVVADRPGA